MRSWISNRRKATLQQLCETPMFTFFGFGLQGIKGKNRLLHREHGIHKFSTIPRLPGKLTNPLCKSLTSLKKGMEVVVTHYLSLAVFQNLWVDSPRFEPSRDSLGPLSSICDCMGRMDYSKFSSLPILNSGESQNPIECSTVSFECLLILGKRNRMEKFLDEGEYLVSTLVPALRLGENPVEAPPLGGHAGTIRKATPLQRPINATPGPTLPKDPRHLLNGGSRKRRRWSDDHSYILQHMLPTRGEASQRQRRGGPSGPDRPSSSRAWPSAAASGWWRPPPAGPAVALLQWRDAAGQLPLACLVPRFPQLALPQRGPLDHQRGRRSTYG